MLHPAPLVVVSTMLAVATGAPLPAQDPARFTAESALVVLHVTVRDRNGAYISGLTADAFRVLDEGRPQVVNLFVPEDAPVTIGLVIDSSGSMRAARDQVIAASAAFVETSNARDEVFGLVFNDDVRAVLPAPQPFTNDATTLSDALKQVFVPAGRTALHDAIADGLVYATKGTRDRRALVVLSDGGDNASHATFDDVLAQAQASNTVVYTVALIDPLETEVNPKRLKRLADASGGTAFVPRDVAGIAGAFQQIASDVRHAYTIGYAPIEAAGPRALHRLRVEARSPDGRRLVTRTRQGYLAGQAGARGNGQ